MRAKTTMNTKTDCLGYFVIIVSVARIVMIP